MPTNSIHPVKIVHTAFHPLTLKLSKLSNAWLRMPKEDRDEIISTAALFAILILILVTSTY